MLRGQVDVKALNIHRQVDVKPNELAKQILLLLPLLLLLLLLLYALHDVLIRGHEEHPYNCIVSTYSRSSSRSSRWFIFGCPMVSVLLRFWLKAMSGSSFVIWCRPVPYFVKL